MTLIRAACLILAAFAFPHQVLAQATATESRRLEAQRAEFYAPPEVQTIHLTISESHRNLMAQSLPKRVYVPATFKWRDIKVDNVAVRFKGNSSSNPRQRHKRSFLIKFSEYDKSQRFLGMRRVSFDNGVQFGSLFSEPIITEILRAEKIPVHRCNYAKLYLNGEYQGVYVNVERIDASFLENNLSNAKGPLYKVHLGGPGANLQLVSEQPQVYEQTFEAKNDRGDKSYGQLVELLKAINRSPSPAYADNLARHLETDDFLKTTAIMLFSGAFDQLTGWGPHNYYLFRDESTGRWRYLPWDLDVGFAETAFGRVRVLADWHAAWPITPGPANPLLERIIADEKLLAKYRQYAQEILERHFQPDELCRRVDEKYALIRDALKDDPFPRARVTVPTDQGYDDIVASIKDFIRKRYATAKAQLKNPGERPQFARQKRRDPRPGEADGGPTDLRARFAEGRGVVLEWKDNATGEAGHIVQRAQGGDGGEFNNHIGFFGPDNDGQAIDRDVRRGQTYRYRVYAVFPTSDGPRGTSVTKVVTIRIPPN